MRKGKPSVKLLRLFVASLKSAIISNKISMRNIKITGTYKMKKKVSRKIEKKSKSFLTTALP